MTTSQTFALWLICTAAATLLARAWGRRQHAIGWNDGGLYQLALTKQPRGQGGRFVKKPATITTDEEPALGL